MDTVKGELLVKGDFVKEVTVWKNQTHRQNAQEIFCQDCSDQESATKSCGMKQGWAFAWRSLMAAEIYVTILTGFGLGYLSHYGRELNAMDQVIGVMLVIVMIGLAVDKSLFVVDGEPCGSEVPFTAGEGAAMRIHS